MWLRDAIDDLGYACSKDNTDTGLRLFNIMVAAGFSIILLGTIVFFVTSCIGITSGITQVIGFVALPVTVIVEALTLKKLMG